jgi:hypothetical protein
MNNVIGPEHPYRQTKKGEAARAASSEEARLTNAANVEENETLKSYTMSSKNFFALEGPIGKISVETENIAHFIKMLYNRFFNLIEDSESNTSMNWVDRLVCLKCAVSEMVPLLDVLSGYSQSCAKEANELWETLERGYPE